MQTAFGRDTKHIGVATIKGLTIACLRPIPIRTGMCRNDMQTGINLMRLESGRTEMELKKCAN
ncbi:hypothetical protein F6453_3911 [Marinobacter nauticus]|jgi:hypothetical protein|uniref:Uncharacterized protein n=1 Tax=Marinobacter nauticus TaxID=2743 RepID=A0A833N899_MARNT|nr:hypothetical protein F6453_3911 [Marinobacter nauticus]